MNELRHHVTELFCTSIELHGQTAHVLAGGDVTVSGPAGDTVHHLDNLIRKVAAAPQKDWAALVADHVGTGLAAADGDDTDPLTARDFTDIHTLIRTRLYPDTCVPPECLHRPVAPGLAQCLVLDRVHTLTAITEQIRATWPVSDTELYALAGRNIRTDGPAEIVQSDYPADAPPWYLLHAGDYTSAHALWLAEYPDITGPHGTLFTIPAELILHATPIHNLDILEAGQLLAKLSSHHYANDPYPISPHLYWCHEGCIELAACVDSSESLTLHPTDEFVSVLNQMAP